MTPAYTITRESVTAVIDGKTYSVKAEDPNFILARQAILNEDWEALPKLLSQGLAILKWAKGDFTFEDNLLRYKGDEIPNEMNDRILRMAEDGKDPSFLMNFWELLARNPSWRSVQQVYGFLQHQNIAIDPEGFIIAYKAVRSDWKDFHSGTVLNEVGSTHEMPRNKISDDPNEACHFGFHVGALGYARSFGNTDRRIIICRVDPADVVCVPYDCSQQKMRVCKYEVIGNYGAELKDTYDPSKDDYDEHSYMPDDMDDEDDYEDEEDEVPNPFSKAAVTQAAVTEVWYNYDNLDQKGLSKESLGDLRKYAANVLKIIGASKIPGGKDALIARILEVRK